jgi:hypothetical protein
MDLNNNDRKVMNLNKCDGKRKVGLLLAREVTIEFPNSVDEYSCLCCRFLKFSHDEKKLIGKRYDCLLFDCEIKTINHGAPMRTDACLLAETKAKNQQI